MNLFSRLLLRVAGCALAALPLATAPIAPANAQSATTPAAPAATPLAANQIPLVIGILDTQALVYASTAGKQLSGQANASLKTLEDNLEKKESALRSQMKTLDAQRAALAPSDYEVKRKQITDQDDKLRADFAKTKQALDERVIKARDSLINAAQKVVQDVAKARGLTLILNRSATELFPTQWDITNDVMQRLNKAMPAVKL